MEDGLFPWSNFHGLVSQKSLGPSLVVNRMWTKRNDHASESACADIYMSKKGSFENDSSLTILLSLTSLLPKNLIKILL